jgi:hypothetical protein
VDFANLSGQNGKSQCKKAEIQWTEAGAYVFELLPDLA